MFFGYFEVFLKEVYDGVNWIVEVFYFIVGVEDNGGIVVSGDFGYFGIFF